MGRDVRGRGLAPRAARCRDTARQASATGRTGPKTAASAILSELLVTFRFLWLMARQPYPVAEIPGIAAPVARQHADRSRKKIPASYPPADGRDHVQGRRRPINDTRRHDAGAGAPARMMA